MEAHPRFGVNYVPARHWWHSWLDWDGASIQDDLFAIAGLRLDHIRVHCVWPVFQPDPAYVSQTALERLEELFAHADRAGLDVAVTVLNGWLSGTYFRPFWQTEKINMFTDSAAIQAETLLFTAIAERIAGHPRFLGFDIANEPNVLTAFPGNAVSVEQGDAWIRRMLEHCELLAPGKLNVVGVDHGPWLVRDAPFSQATLGSAGAATAVHAWAFFTGALARYGPAGTGSRHLSEYLIELAKAYHTDPSRLVWLQEIGVAPEWIDEDDIASFVADAVAASISCDRLWGITWWASHDIDRRFSGFDDLEYSLGLLTVDNTVKPMGAQLAELIRQSALLSTPEIRDTALVLPDGVAPDLDFADRFFSLVDQGVRPAITQAESMKDPQYLASRGITALR